jgi:hypothetical protein
VRNFQVTVRRVGGDVRDHIDIAVDGGGAIPQGVSVGAFGDESRGSDVLTGDPVFDRAVRVAGHEATAVAWLDGRTRELIQAELSRNLKIQNGVLTIKALDFFLAGNLRPLLSTAVELAERLTMREDEVPQRLLRNLTTETVFTAGRRALELLQLRFPDHSAAREAIQVALASPAPELRLPAARYLGKQGLVHVRELVVSEDVPTDLRLEALVHYALAAPVPEALALVERGGGRLAEAELSAEAAEALAEVDDSAREPVLLQLLGLAPDSLKVATARGLGPIGTVAAVEPLLVYRDGAEWSDELRQAAGEAIAQIQARLGNVEAGRLSVAAPVAAAGGLTAVEPDGTGGLSLVGEPANVRRRVRRGRARRRRGPAET